MRYLVDDATQEVRAGFQFPLQSSIAGHFVVDVPDELGVVPESSFLPDLLDAKLNAYLAAHSNLPTGKSGEFLGPVSAEVDVSLSSGCFLGPNKKVALLPGGHVQTTVNSLLGVFTKIFLHYGVFTLFQDSPDIGADYPGPSRTLYGWDSSVLNFVEPDPAIVQVSLMDSTGAVTLVPTMFSDSIISYASGNLATRLKFLNTSATRTLYLSDYYLLWG
jgi:hypothetical protein